MSAVTPVALVTGASRGLGRGIAIELARGGCSVVINFRKDHDAAGETVRLCREVGKVPEQQFVPIRGDVGRRDDHRHLLDVTLDRLGRIDALINNAGIAPPVRADLTETDETSYDQVMGTNLRGPFFLTQLVVNHWLEIGDREPTALGVGRLLVFITSISADTASINRGEYCLSKAALSMLSKLWATRLACEPIRVYEVRPGIMATDMTSAVRERYDSLISDGLVPQRRWGTAADVGRAVAMLGVGALEFATGQVLEVDGGFGLKRL